jgi:hypothetical protein
MCGCSIGAGCSPWCHCSCHGDKSGQRVLERLVRDRKRVLQETEEQIKRLRYEVAALEEALKAVTR